MKRADLRKRFWGVSVYGKYRTQIATYLGDIINAAIQTGFQIDCADEHYVEKESKRVFLVPTDFLLVATEV